MNKCLRFYNYEQCYAHYTKRIITMRQAKIKGEKILAKPVLLVAVIDSINAGEILCNQIKLTDALVSKYNMLMSYYARGSQFDNITDINNPFWHLQGDGFWYLQGKGPLNDMKTTPSRSWLKANIKYAYVDDDLWTLLQNRVMRERLRDYIILHKLNQPDDNILMRAAESFGTIAAMVLAAA